MERHPLVFLSILIVFGLLLGSVIALQLVIARGQDRHERILSAMHQSLADLTTLAEGSA